MTNIRLGVITKEKFYCLFTSVDMQTVRAFPPVQRLTISVRGDRNLRDSLSPNLLNANLSANCNLTVPYVTPVRLLLSCGF